MSDPSVAVDGLEAADVLHDHAAKVAFDGIVVLQECGDGGNMLVAELVRLEAKWNASLLADFQGSFRPDAVYIAEGDLNPFVSGDVDAENSWHVHLYVK